MFIKIYWNDKQIYLSQNSDKIIIELSRDEKFIFYKTKDEVDIHSALSEIINAESNCFLISHEDLGFLQNAFFNHFHLIEAAGGIVLNNKKEILFIFRRDKWDLPKGKMEIGESPEICAEREIEEETGVTPLLINCKLTETYHIYLEKGKTILKTTHWFLFNTEFHDKLIPQTEEGITDIKWFQQNEITAPLSNTFSNIKDVMDLYMHLNPYDA